MTMDRGDWFAIFMILWKLAEYLYIFVKCRYEYRHALPVVQLIVDAFRHEVATLKNPEYPPKKVTAATASTYGEGCPSSSESRRHSIQKPGRCFFQKTINPCQEAIADAPEDWNRPFRADTTSTTLIYGDDHLYDAESRRNSVPRSGLCFLRRKKVPSLRDMIEVLILSQIKNHDALQQLLLRITPIHRPVDEHWNDRYIRFINIEGIEHRLLVETCKSPGGFIHYLMSTLRDCARRRTELKGIIERGEFWVVDENNNLASPHRIGFSLAILADNWEENVIAGRTFRMIAAGASHVPTPDELLLMHRTWHSHVKASLQEICHLTHWEFNND